jgi:hypothetical protein
VVWEYGLPRKEGLPFGQGDVRGLVGFECAAEFWRGRREEVGSKGDNGGRTVKPSWNSTSARSNGCW